MCAGLAMGHSSTARRVVPPLHVTRMIYSFGSWRGATACSLVSVVLGEAENTGYLVGFVWDRETIDVGEGNDIRGRDRDPLLVMLSLTGRWVDSVALCFGNTPE